MEKKKKKIKKDDFLFTKKDEFGINIILVPYFWYFFWFLNFFDSAM
jgi:hypothetical protein